MMMMMMMMMMTKVTMITMTKTVMKATTTNENENDDDYDDDNGERRKTKPLSSREGERGMASVARYFFFRLISFFYSISSYVVSFLRHPERERE